MLSALTDRERRILLAILAVLVLGAAVKLWRWRTGQRSEPAGESTPAAAMVKFPALTMAGACVEGGGRSA